MLLVDEIDKTDVEVEALLLEVLSDFQVTIPEMGTVTATRRPFVVLTSNANRELSEALKRRCLYLYLDYPSPERERDILLERVPGLERCARRAGRPRGRDAAHARPAQVAVAGRVDRLGAHPARARHRRPRRRRRWRRRSAWCSSTSPTTPARRKELDLPAVDDMSLVDRHHEFVAALRGAGLPVSVAEDIDAASALGVVDLLDRDQVRAAYAAALVKRHTDRPAFDTLFDLYFPAVLGDADAPASADPEPRDVDVPA